MDLERNPLISSSAYLNRKLRNHRHNFTFGHLNCRSIRPSSYSVTIDELKNFLVDSGIDAFGISETWLKSSVSTKSVSINGYSFIRNDRPVTRGGGVGIFISRKLKYKTVFKSDSFGDCESLFLEIQRGPARLLFGVVYLPHGNLDEFVNTHTDLMSRYSEIVIVGDFNRNMFNISQSNIMRNVSHGLGLSVSHNCLPTHYDVAHNTCSLIDFFLLSNPAKLKLSSQGQCASISHHALIFGSYDFDITYLSTYVEFRDYRRINWDGIINYLTSFDSTSLYASMDVDFQLSVINDLISSLFTFVPLVRRSVSHVRDPWLSSREVVVSRSLMDLAHRNDDSIDVSERFDEFSFDCIYEDDIYDAVQRVRSGSVGVDGIPIKFIRIILPYILRYILYLFNTIVTTSVYPMAWKLARVVPVPKTARSGNIDNFRPISILPALSKIFDSIILKTTLNFVNDCDMISSHQYGFRNGYSTTSNLLHMTDAIRSATDIGLCSSLVALDLSKAFDRIDHHKLIRKLATNYRFSITACRLFNSYISGRSQYVCISGVNSSIRSVTSGVPQGSILRPLLFVLFINDVVNHIDNSYCTPFLYADDIHILFSCASVEGLQSQVNRTMDVIKCWLDDNGLHINAHKSKALCFGSQWATHPEFVICYDGARIDIVESMRCLGVTIDNRLDFSAHFNLLTSRIILLLRRLYSTNSYFPCNIRKRIALGLLMPHVYYGLEVTSGTSASNFSRVRQLVHTIVRYVYRLRRHDHVSRFVSSFLGFPFDSLVDVKLLTLFYGIIKSGLPPLLRSYFVFTRTSRNPQILIPNMHSQ
ncbi:uncharacterized protein LOC142235791 [Haematobia irritans]|uniref:uncharacterized protein LOC142235791 n=1 Tax=Haematobia irritans TaxID=7368 RepID=UPI003F4FA704